MPCCIECDYNSNLFDGDTIRHWLGGFQTLLAGVVSNANQQLSRLPMLSEAERTSTSQALPERSSAGLTRTFEVRRGGIRCPW